MEHSRNLEQLLRDSSLDDWFRKAGGLKPMLKDVMVTLKSPQLIYNDELVTNDTSLTRKIELLCCALPLGSVLEDQGKEGERTALMNTLEQLRKAAKADMPALLPVVKDQANKVCRSARYQACIDLRRINASCRRVGNLSAQIRSLLIASATNEGSCSIS